MAVPKEMVQIRKWAYHGRNLKIELAEHLDDKEEYGSIVFKDLFNRPAIGKANTLLLIGAIHNSGPYLEEAINSVKRKLEK